MVITRHGNGTPTHPSIHIIEDRIQRPPPCSSMPSVADWAEIVRTAVLESDAAALHAACLRGDVVQVRRCCMTSLGSIDASTRDVTAACLWVATVN